MIRLGRENGSGTRMADIFAGPCRAISDGVPGIWGPGGCQYGSQIRNRDHGSARADRIGCCPPEAQWFAEIGVVTFAKVLVASPDAVTALLSQMPILLSKM